MEEVGRRIKALRQAKGWTQEELAHRLGVTWKTVLRWESGQSQPSSMALQLIQDLEEKVGRRVSSEEIVKRIFRALTLALQAHDATWPEEEVQALAERIYELTREEVKRE